MGKTKPEFLTGAAQSVDKATPSSRSRPGTAATAAKRKIRRLTRGLFLTPVATSAQRI